MKPKDLRERSVEDLRELEKSLAKDLFQNRFKNFTNRLDDTSALPKARRDLARVKTILRQLELNKGAAENAPVKSKPAKKKAAAPKKEAKPAAKKTTAKKKAAKKEEAK